MESLHDCEGRLACKGNPKTGYDNHFVVEFKSGIEITITE